jgi:hypothetical protein
LHPPSPKAGAAAAAEPAAGAEGVRAAEPVVAVEWAAVVADPLEWVETLAQGAATAPVTVVVSGWVSVIPALTMVVSALGVAEARRAGSRRAQAEERR